MACCLLAGIAIGAVMALIRLVRAAGPSFAGDPLEWRRAKEKR